MESRACKSLAVLVMALACCSGGCAVSGSGTQISQESIASLNPGQTTYAEAIATLGQPSSISAAPDGTRSATYAYKQEYDALVIGAVVEHTLLLEFDKNGVLQRKVTGYSTAGGAGPK